MVDRNDRVNNRDGHPNMFEEFRMIDERKSWYDQFVEEEEGEEEEETDDEEVQ